MKKKTDEGSYGIYPERAGNYLSFCVNKPQLLIGKHFTTCTFNVCALSDVINVKCFVQREAASIIYIIIKTKLLFLTGL